MKEFKQMDYVCGCEIWIRIIINSSSKPALSRYVYPDKVIAVVECTLHMCFILMIYFISDEFN